MKMDSYFQATVDRGASDVHLVAGQIPALRIDGILENIATEVMASQDLETMIAELVGPEKYKKLQEHRELDLAYAFTGARFRINVHYQQGALAVAARLIPKEIPTPEALGFNATMLGFTHLPHGLVLVTGPTGSGKSSTLAAMVNSINHERRAHIVTMEDPVEFVYTPDKCVIAQREVGSDTLSFGNALKYVLRQDPNIILVGEMRDEETIQAVLTAAETGHLVFSTLHTSSAADTIERIIDTFDGARQKQVLVQLASSLRAVIAQRLLPKKGGGRVAAREILVINTAAGAIIRENKIVEMEWVMQTFAQEGMITMEKAVKQLFEAGLIEATTASEAVIRKMEGKKA